MKVLENGIVREATAEEIEAMTLLNPYEGLSYPELVVTFIRERYTLDDEIALHRQRDEKPEEYKAYYDFCEDCKARAKSLIEDVEGG